MAKFLVFDEYQECVKIKDTLEEAKIERSKFLPHGVIYECTKIHYFEQEVKLIEKTKEL